MRAFEPIDGNAPGRGRASRGGRQSGQPSSTGQDGAPHPPAQGTRAPGRAAPPPPRRAAWVCQAPLCHWAPSPTCAHKWGSALLLPCPAASPGDSSLWVPPALTRFQGQHVPVRTTPLSIRGYTAHSASLAPGARVAVGTSAPRIPALGGFSFRTTDAAQQRPAWRMLALELAWDQSSTWTPRCTSRALPEAGVSRWVGTSSSSPGKCMSVGEVHVCRLCLSFLLGSSALPARVLCLGT